MTIQKRGSLLGGISNLLHEWDRAMTAEEYLVRMRETYVERYRSALRERRREGFDCTPEVWVDPNVPPGEPKPPHPLCIDIIVQGKDGPSMVM